MENIDLLNQFVIDMFNYGFKISAGSYVGLPTIVVDTGNPEHIVEIVFFKDLSVLVSHSLTHTVDYILSGNNKLLDFATSERHIFDNVLNVSHKSEATDKFQDSLYRVIG